MKKPLLVQKHLDPFDVEALEKAVNDSATRFSVIWVSFMLFSLYLAIAAGGVSHRQLLLEEPITLPVLDIDLPLRDFFFLAPILFLLFHAYVIVQVLLLGRTAAAYSEALDKAIKPTKANAVIRQRLINTLFAQIFAGSPRERGGSIGSLLNWMAWVTLAIAPVLVLLVFQFKFLPYHSHALTWSHRALILAELVTVFLLWPLVLDAKRDFDWRLLLRRGFIRTASTFLVISCSLATFPGEPHLNLMTANAPTAIRCERWISFIPKERVSGSPRLRAWYNFDRLDLPRVDVVDDDKLAKIARETKEKERLESEGESTLNLRNRNLECGNFEYADFRRVDFTDADLTGANLDHAELQAAVLDRASLFGASLQNAVLDHTSLEGTDLRNASAISASFRNAWLADIKLQSADLSYATFEGAFVVSAEMQDANLNNARLRGTVFSDTEMVGADLTDAKMQGAILQNVRLQGSTLSRADLGGANLTRVELQGVLFNGSNLDKTNIEDSILWRASEALCNKARIENPRFEASIRIRLDKERSEYELVPLSSQALEQFVQMAVQGVLDANKSNLVEKLRVIFHETDSTSISESERLWSDCAERTSPDEEYYRQLALYFVSYACSKSWNSYFGVEAIIQTWLAAGIFLSAPLSEFRTLFSRGLLGEDQSACQTSITLSDPTRKSLQGILVRPSEE